MTSQILDRLRCGGEEFELSCLPRLPPAEHLRRSPDGTPLGKDRLDIHAAHSTACWRRYVAQWSIHDGRLYLDRLFGPVHLLAPGPLAADWYTGELVIQYGRIIVPGMFGLDRLREREHRIRVEAGRVVGERWVDNSGIPRVQGYGVAAIGIGRGTSDSTCDGGSD